MKVHRYANSVLVLGGGIIVNVLFGNILPRASTDENSHPCVVSLRKTISIRSEVLFKWLINRSRRSDKKGYGFIIPDEGGKDIFVHCAEIKVDSRVSINEGQKVEYEIIEGEKGPVATNVIPS